MSLAGREERLSPAVVRGVRHWFPGENCQQCVDLAIKKLEAL